MVYEAKRKVKKTGECLHVLSFRVTLILILLVFYFDIWICGFSMDVNLINFQSLI